jgi:Tol biopolymer transport system component
MALPLTGDRKPFPVVKHAGVVDEPEFSPDGRWVAYNADDSGRHEVYVKAFPPSDDRWQISTAGGAQPHWRGDGRELYFLAPDGSMMAAEIRTSAAVEASSPRVLFRTRLGANGTTDQYDVTPRGDRFLLMLPAGDRRLPPFGAIPNWPSLLR